MTLAISLHINFVTFGASRAKWLRSCQHIAKYLVIANIFLFLLISTYLKCVQFVLVFNGSSFLKKCHVTSLALLLIICLLDHMHLATLMHTLQGSVRKGEIRSIVKQHNKLPCIF